VSATLCDSSYETIFWAQINARGTKGTIQIPLDGKGCGSFLIQLKDGLKVITGLPQTPPDFKIQMDLSPGGGSNAGRSRPRWYFPEEDPVLGKDRSGDETRHPPAGLEKLADIPSVILSDSFPERFLSNPDQPPVDPWVQRKCRI
jgi:hypothetical protein